MTPTIDYCQWFLRCENEATTTRPHPILGNVLCCDRCAAIVDKQRENKA